MRQGTYGPAASALFRSFLETPAAGGGGVRRMTRALLRRDAEVTLKLCSGQTAVNLGMAA